MDVDHGREGGEDRIGLAAGSPRYVRPGARIGIHGASVKGVETAEAMAGTVVMARIAADYGIPDAIVARPVKTPGDRIVWLTPDEVRSIVGEVAYQPYRHEPTRTREVRNRVCRVRVGSATPYGEKPAGAGCC